MYQRISELCITKRESRYVISGLIGLFPSSTVFHIFVYSGDAQLKLQAFDPLHITRINLKQGGQSPVNIELNFKDVDLTGLSQQTCTLVK